MRLDFCALCARKEGLEHHHFRPLSLGGSDDETNLFTVCGECHGKIHDIPRPLFLGDLIKAGRDKERTAEELQKIAASRAISAQNAEIKAKEAEEAAWREIERLRRIARRQLPKMPTDSPPTPIEESEPAVPVLAFLPAPPETKQLAPSPPKPKKAFIMTIGKKHLNWSENELKRAGRLVASIEPDSKYPNMWRVRLPDGNVSDMLNKTRARDAAASLVLGRSNKQEMAA